MDFVAGETYLTLMPGETLTCSDIGVFSDDNALEPDEVFGLELYTLFEPFPLPISTAEVTIVDDGCKCL